MIGTEERPIVVAIEMDAGARRAGLVRWNAFCEGEEIATRSTAPTDDACLALLAMKHEGEVAFVHAEEGVVGPVAEIEVAAASHITEAQREAVCEADSHRLIVGGALVLHGPVGGSFEKTANGFVRTGFSKDEVEAALQHLSGDITVRINSNGGRGNHGFAIYHALREYPGLVTVEIEPDGAACSAASIIAMAGDVVIMHPGARLMIHAPQAVTTGTAEVHRFNAAVLDSLAADAAETYAAKSGRPVAEMLLLLRSGEDIWLNRAEAEALGFCDKMTSVQAGGHQHGCDVPAHLSRAKAKL